MGCDPTATEAGQQAGSTAASHGAAGRREEPRARLGEGVAGIVGLGGRARDDSGLATGGVVALNEGRLKGRGGEPEEGGGSLRGAGRPEKVSRDTRAVQTRA